jgi:hypothetical protein
VFVNLRGPSGSGKSYIGHQFLEEFAYEELWEDGWNKSKPKLVGYQLINGLYVLGPYRAPGGGMDLLSPHDRKASLWWSEKFIGEGRFIFLESLIFSSTVPPFLEVVARHPGERFVFAFLDTPFDLCIQRVYQRNGGKPIKEENVRSHHAYMGRVARRLQDLGQRVVIIDHTRAYEQVKELFIAGGWRP